MWTNIWLMLILFHDLIAISPATLVCSLQLFIWTNQLMKENSINENYLWLVCPNTVQICTLLNINLPIAEALTNLFLFV